MVPDSIEKKWKIHPKIVKNMYFGGLGGSRGGLGEGLGAILAPRHEKMKKKWFVGGPPPKLDPKIAKNRYVGVPECNFIDQSVTLGGILYGSGFVAVFGRSEERKNYDFQTVEPLKSDDSTVFL